MSYLLKGSSLLNGKSLLKRSSLQKRVVGTTKRVIYTNKCRHYQKGSSLLVKRVVFTKIKGVNECRLAITKEGNFLIKGLSADNRRSVLWEERTKGGQQEESRTAGGVEDSGRSRGQREELRTA